MSVSAILQERMKKKDQKKMAQMAEQTVQGQLTTFSGVFSMADLTVPEAEELKSILERYAPNGRKIDSDLVTLKAITCEVKAINNQAALLHGERIKRAQAVFKNYEEGAFSAWLMVTYGNRQSPYNFLQYFEFFNAVAKELQPLVETLPRQAIYVLASRKAPLEEKIELMKRSTGQSKAQVLAAIRSAFPSIELDRRTQRPKEQIAFLLKRALRLLKDHKLTLTEKQALSTLIENIREHIPGE